MARNGWKPCPLCGEKIRESAVYCRHCGNALTPEIEEALRRGHARPPAEEPVGSDVALERLSKFVPQRVFEGIVSGVETVEEGERRTVTLLFADLCGFTQLTEATDPEQLAEIVDEAYGAMEAAVTRYEGIVDKFVGDAVMAIFGTPLAHEDDPERAVRAGLDLLRSIQAIGRRRQLPLNARVGIATGQVIIKVFGTSRRADYTAIGDAVNLASRLEQRAAPGEVLITEPVARQVQGLFEVDSLAPVEIKGKSQPVAVHRVLREVKSFKSALSVRATVSPFVGRAAELRTLAELLDRACEGEALAVSLRGEAGVGKSRLLYELFHRHARLRADWYTGRCTSYGGSIPFQPLSELVRRMAEIEEADPVPVRRRKVAQLVDGLTGRSGKRNGGATLRPALEHLLSISRRDSPIHGLSPRDRKERLFTALIEVARRAGQRRPTVLVFEDLHWADAHSLEFLQRLTADGTVRQLLVITVSRPTRDLGLPPSGRQRELSLSELSPEDSARLLNHLLGSTRMAPSVDQFLTRRCQGNPFFVEEMALALRESGDLVEEGGVLRFARPMGQIQVPATLEALILSRLDRLEARARQVVQCASVIGQEFRERVLRHVTEMSDRLHTALTTLMARDLILEKAAQPEMEYLFRHIITRDVAYHSLLSRRRRLYHLRIAQAIEQLYPDRLEEHVELLAHHYFLGGASEEARQHLRRAAEKCRLLDANLAALDFTERLLIVLRTRLGPTAEVAREIADALLELGRLAMLTGDYAGAETRYREAAAHAKANRLRVPHLVALRNLGEILRLRGRPAEGVQVLKRALAACGTRDAALRATCDHNLGVQLLYLGRLREAGAAFSRFLRHARSRGGDARQLYAATANLGLVQHALGRLREAARLLTRAGELAEEIGRRREVAESLLNLARVEIDRGCLEEAHACLQRSLHLAEAVDHGRLIPNIRLCLSEVAHHRGRFEEAEALTASLLHEAREGGQEHMETVLCLNLAQICLAQGRLEEAESHIIAAESTAQAREDRSLLAPILAVRAQIAAARGRLEEARRAIQRALRAQRDVGGNRDEAFLSRAEGAVELAAGDGRAARRHAQRAIRLAEKQGLAREAAHAHALAARIDRGHPNGKTSRHRQRARVLAAGVGDEALLATLAN